MRSTLHIAQHATDLVEFVLHSRLRADALTTPAAVQAWAEWTPTDQWMAEHGRKENTDA